MIKNTYKKSTGNNILNGKTQCFLIIRNKARISAITTLTQHRAGRSSYCPKAIKEIKDIHQKGKNMKLPLSVDDLTK